jgi:predicted GIY-YIG superfamily endonuclease
VIEKHNNNYNKYRIIISEGKYRCVEANGESSDIFLSPDATGKLPKLYVIRHVKEIVYVGITRQDVRMRLRMGFGAKGEHGYYGYKWKDLRDIELLVWTFPGHPDSHAEAIEAELVYYIREKTGHWPKYQIEIHFHGASTEQRDNAKSILRQCLL